MAAWTYFTCSLALTREIFFSTRRNFVSPGGHVISSIYAIFLLSLYIHFLFFPTFELCINLSLASERILIWCSCGTKAEIKVNYFQIK